MNAAILATSLNVSVKAGAYRDRDELKHSAEFGSKQHSDSEEPQFQRLIRERRVANPGSHLAFALLGLVLLGLVGCNDEPKRPIPMRSTSFYSTEPIDIHLGAKLMRIPWNMLSHSPGYARKFIGKGPFKMDEVHLAVWGPDMEGAKEGVPMGLNLVWITIQAYEKNEPSPRQVHMDYLRERMKDLVGPYPSKTTGMEEWRDKSSGLPRAFALVSSKAEDAEMLAPMLFCDYYSGSSPPKIYWCGGRGFFNHSFNYGYQIYPPLVDVWPEVVSAIRKLVLSLVVEGVR